MGKEGVYAELEHVRLVHFTVLVMSGVLLYIYFALDVWSLTPKLEHELDELDGAVTGLERGDPAEIARDWPVAIDDNLLAAQRDLERATGLASSWRSSATDALRGVVRVRDLDPSWPDPTRESMRVTRARLEQHSWQWRVFDHFELANPDKVLAWGKSVAAAGDLGAVYADVSLTERPGDVFDVIVTIDVERCFATAAPDPNAPPVVHCRIDEEVPLSGRLITRNDRRALPPSWFAGRFPTVAATWDRLQEMSVKAARDELESDRAAEVYGKKATLLGIDIEGRHLGAVGPILLFIALAYLVAYLWQIAHASAPPGLSPWLGAMPSRLARGVSTLTLAIAPVVGYLVLRGFVEWPIWLALVFVLPHCALCGMIAALGNHVASARGNQKRA